MAYTIYMSDRKAEMAEINMRAAVPGFPGTVQSYQRLSRKFGCRTQ